MNALILALVFATTPPPVWQFEGEPASPHHIHVLRDGQDLGRCVIGTGYADLSKTWYDLTTGTMHLIPDQIFGDYALLDGTESPALSSARQAGKGASI